jgi:hypothetical protein
MFVLLSSEMADALAGRAVAFGISRGAVKANPCAAVIASTKARPATTENANAPLERGVDVTATGSDLVVRQ